MTLEFAKPQRLSVNGKLRDAAIPEAIEMLAPQLSLSLFLSSLLEFASIFVLLFSSSQVTSSAWLKRNLYQKLRLLAKLSSR